MPIQKTKLLDIPLVNICEWAYDMLFIHKPYREQERWKYKHQSRLLGTEISPIGTPPQFLETNIENLGIILKITQCLFLLSKCNSQVSYWHLAAIKPTITLSLAQTLLLFLLLLLYQTRPRFETHNQVNAFPCHKPCISFKSIFPSP